MKISVRIATIGALLALTACNHHGAMAGSGATGNPTGDATATSIKNAQGSESIGGAVDPATLGVPIYPGAAAVAGSQIATASKQSRGAVATFETSAAFSTVEAFYRRHLPAGAERVTMTLSDGSMAEFQVGDQTTRQMTLVTVRSENDRTAIVISNLAQS